MHSTVNSHPLGLLRTNDALQSPGAHKQSNRVLLRRLVGHREFGLCPRVEIEPAKLGGILPLIEIALRRPVRISRVLQHFAARPIEAPDVIDELALVVEPPPKLRLAAARKPDRRPLR